MSCCRCVCVLVYSGVTHTISKSRRPADCETASCSTGSREGQNTPTIFQTLFVTRLKAALDMCCIFFLFSVISPTPSQFLHIKLLIFVFLPLACIINALFFSMKQTPWSRFLYSTAAVFFQFCILKIYRHTPKIHFENKKTMAFF